MKTVAAHLADLRSLLAPRIACERTVLDAVGTTLAEDVHAPTDLPTFATSAMDGYAVRVADCPGTLLVVGDVPAGTMPTAAVSGGRAVRVMTGSPLPVGTETVIPVEDTDAGTDRVQIRTAGTAGRHLRSAGEDLHAGDLLLPSGTRIGPTQLGALLAAGLTTVNAHPPARVAVLSTGDELVPSGTTPGPAQLVDSNGPALAAAARAAGAEVVFVGHAGDDPPAFLAALDALPAVDLVVTSGGVSMGAYDVVKAALRPRGVHFESVAMQPGKPQAWGRLGEGPAFLGLPGNPVSALVCFEVFGRAVLGCERPVLRASLAHPVAHSAPGRRQYLRGRLDAGGARVVSGPASHLLAGLARADCLVVVPEDVTSLPAGADVEVIPLT
jgi:molybdopterin molybdotransferase